MDVWYVAYGSNISPARLACYLAGGTADGSMRHNSAAFRRGLIESGFGEAAATAHLASLV